MSVFYIVRVEIRRSRESDASLKKSPKNDNQKIKFYNSITYFILTDIIIREKCDINNYYCTSVEKSSILSIVKGCSRRCYLAVATRQSG